MYFEAISLSILYIHTDKQTDKQTDRQTDRQTDKFLMQFFALITDKDRYFKTNFVDLTLVSFVILFIIIGARMYIHVLSLKIVVVLLMISCPRNARKQTHTHTIGRTNAQPVLAATNLSLGLS